jgi:serine/threonine protein kinase
VSELLQQNLYEFGKRLRAHRTAVASSSNTSSNSSVSSSSDGGVYFTPNRLARLAMQCLEALAYINSLGLMHCDVKVRKCLSQRLFPTAFVPVLKALCSSSGNGFCNSIKHTAAIA